MDKHKSIVGSSGSKSTKIQKNDDGHDACLLETKPSYLRDTLLRQTQNDIKVCLQMERGIFTLIAPTSDPSYDTFAAYSNIFQMPLVSPAFPQQTSSDRPSHVGVNLRPRYLKAIVDVINYYTWKTIIYLFDSDNGALTAICALDRNSNS